MRRLYWWRLGAALFASAGIGLLGGETRIHAQEPVPVPVPVPAEGAPSPVTPSPTIPPAAEAVPDAPTGTPREAALEDRVRQLEAMVQELAAARAAAPAPAPAATGAKPATPVGPGPSPGNPTGAAPSPGSGPAVAGGLNTPSASTNPNASYINSTGAIAPGQGTPSNPVPSARFSMPPTAPNYPGAWKFGPGFEFKTPDDEFVLQFHNLTQVDYRGYDQGGQNPVHDTFAIPRQWFMFSGRLEKPYEYFVSLQNGFDTVTMLDVFLNIHFDDRLQFKFGRYKTPFTYEFYALPIQGLLQPERSLFFNNFGANRQVGFQAWGQLFDKSLDYAVGVFNAARNSFLDNTDGKEFLAFLNWRPFKNLIDSPLETFNVGGSVMYADANNVAVPGSLRTQVPTSGNAAIGIPFLSFNGNTRERGPRAFWDLHAAYYYKQLSVIAEWQSGYQDYALANTLQEKSRIPIESFYIQAGYFLTGETVSGRNVVKPLRNFDLRPGYRGPGAIELTGRYNYLQMGNQVFTGGFADPNQSSRSVFMTDLGVNWYWTQQIKWYFNWQHASFGSPVVFAPDRYQTTSDTFWARLQVYF